MEELKNSMENPGIKHSHLRCSNIKEMHMDHLLGHLRGIKVCLKLFILSLFFYAQKYLISLWSLRGRLYRSSKQERLAYFHTLQGCSDLNRLQITKANEWDGANLCAFQWQEQPALLIGIWSHHRSRESAVLLPVHILIRVLKSISESLRFHLHTQPKHLAISISSIKILAKAGWEISQISHLFGQNSGLCSQRVEPVGVAQKVWVFSSDTRTQFRVLGGGCDFYWSVFERCLDRSAG